MKAQYKGCQRLELPLRVRLSASLLRALEKKLGWLHMYLRGWISQHGSENPTRNR